MADFNRVILMGRIVKMYEVNVGKTSNLKFINFRLAVGRSKKDASGNWVNNPDTMYIDVTAFDRNEQGGNASVVERYCTVGSTILVEGKLQLDEWEDKNGGGKRSKHKVTADIIQLVNTKPQDGQGGGSYGGGGSNSRDMDDEEDVPPPPARSAPRPPAGNSGGRPAGNSGGYGNAPRGGGSPPQRPKPEYNDDFGGGGGSGDEDIPF